MAHSAEQWIWVEVWRQFCG